MDDQTITIPVGTLHAWMEVVEDAVNLLTECTNFEDWNFARDREMPELSDKLEAVAKAMWEHPIND